MPGKLRWTFALLIVSLSLSGCNVDVQGEGQNKNVDVHTVFGDISVRTSDKGVDTGLPVYPGAKLLQGDSDESGSADVNVGTSFVGVHVKAAKYESKDAPQAVVDFYRDELGKFGTVVACNGDVNFEGEPKQPVCKEDSGSGEIQLVTGTEDNHRMVSVKPRGAGSEFAVVAIQIDERD
ncbi:MAG TPA: hypothetical protein VLD59_13420 [Steroidobacteraceae bacterium]|nr:hypothetical protein [Steroidobacteraceae bacterium]